MSSSSSSAPISGAIPIDPDAKALRLAERRAKLEEERALGLALREQENTAEKLAKEASDLAKALEASMADDLELQQLEAEIAAEVASNQRLKANQGRIAQLEDNLEKVRLRGLRLVSPR